jgi:hypothetical protein
MNLGFLSFRTRSQPYMVRRSYRYEMRSALTFPLAASLAEGGFTGVVAAKYFQADAFLVALITAAPMFGNIAAMMWAELARGRPKVRFVSLLQLGVVITIASVALTSIMPLSAARWVFALQIILARILASGIITIRSVIWRANYPPYIRGQIIGRISMVATAMLMISTLAGSRWLDHNPQAYIWLYPAAALLGVVGIWQFSHIRVRREEQALRREQLHAIRPEELAQTGETNLLNYQPERRGFRPFFHDAWTVLRTDRQFRQYQRYQFLSGFSFMMLGPSLLYMVSTEMTDARSQYLLATVVLQVIPMVVSMLCYQFWSPLFDRVHITVFRVYQTSVSVLAQLTLFAGAMVGLHLGGAGGLVGGLAIVIFGQGLMGVSNAGGNLAWNLGHNDFATGEKAATYMGIHVMLTGLRGCIAPFVGAGLYQSPWIGRWIFAISAGVCTLALLGFIRMARKAPGKPRPRPPGQ